MHTSHPPTGTSLCEDFPDYNQCDVAVSDTLAGVGAILQDGRANHNLLLHIGDISYAVGYEWVRKIVPRLPVCMCVRYVWLWSSVVCVCGVCGVYGV